MKLRPKSEFSRNILTLMTGTVIAQAISIAITPVLTRIYSPEDFGVFALYMDLVSILSIIATGRYEQAVLLPNKDVPAYALMVGVPAKQIGWMSEYGEKLELPLDGEAETICPHTQHTYHLSNKTCKRIY